MRNHQLNAENILRALPEVLRSDEKIYALAKSIADKLAARVEEIDSLRIFPRIDELPEALLDILAYDFKIDWWDYNYSLDQKRQILKDSFLVHKRLGTKYAVETAISAIYPDTTVQEWFQYDGDPYGFKLVIDATELHLDLDRHYRVLALVDFYKNLRSHLDGIEYVVNSKNPATIRIGGQLGSIVKLGIPLIADEFKFEETVRFGGRLATITTITMPNPQEV